jgi:hypothetical protein
MGSASGGNHNRERSIFLERLIGQIRRRERLGGLGGSRLTHKATRESLVRPTKATKRLSTDARRTDQKNEKGRRYQKNKNFVDMGYRVAYACARFLNLELSRHWVGARLVRAKLRGAVQISAACMLACAGLGYNCEVPCSSAVLASCALGGVAGGEPISTDRLAQLGGACGRCVALVREASIARDLLSFFLFLDKETDSRDGIHP